MTLRRPCGWRRARRQQSCHPAQGRHQTTPPAPFRSRMSKSFEHENPGPPWLVTSVAAAILSPARARMAFCHSRITQTPAHKTDTLPALPESWRCTALRRQTHSHDGDDLCSGTGLEAFRPNTFKTPIQASFRVQATTKLPRVRCPGGTAAGQVDTASAACMPPRRPAAATLPHMKTFIQGDM